jgi:hypothetical protein
VEKASSGCRLPRISQKLTPSASSADGLSNGKDEVEESVPIFLNRTFTDVLYASMAEALGIASGAAGIVALGLEITQGLLRYYSAWRDQDKDIKSMYGSLTVLSKLLLQLERRIQTPAIFDIEAISRTTRPKRCPDNSFDFVVSFRR